MSTGRFIVKLSPPLHKQLLIVDLDYLDSKLANGHGERGEGSRTPTDEGCFLARGEPRKSDLMCQANARS